LIGDFDGSEIIGGFFVMGFFHLFIIGKIFEELKIGVSLCGVVFDEFGPTSMENGSCGVSISLNSGEFVQLNFDFHIGFKFALESKSLHHFTDMFFGMVMVGLFVLFLESVRFHVREKRVGGTSILLLFHVFLVTVMHMNSSDGR